MVDFVKCMYAELQYEKMSAWKKWKTTMCLVKNGERARGSGEPFPPEIPLQHESNKPLRREEPPVPKKHHLTWMERSLAATVVNDWHVSFCVVTLRWPTRWG